MKSKTALVLVVVLVACLAFVLIRNTDLFRPAKPVEKPAVSKGVFDTTPLGIVRVVVTPADGARLVLAKQAGEWRIEEPFHARADTYKVNTLLDALSQLKSARSFAAGDKDAVDPNITSVDKPLWTVELADAKGGLWKLAVGKPLPLRPGETYVRPEGPPAMPAPGLSDKRTHVALADLAETLQRPAREYRDRTIVRFNASQAVELKLAGREVREAYEIQKQKDEWGIVKPFSARADQDAIREILGALSFLSVESFVADVPVGLAGYGLEEGKERLVVRVSVQAEPNVPAPAPATSSMPATAATQESTSQAAPASMPAPKVYAVAFGERTGDKVYAKLLGEPAVFQMSASVLDNILKKMEGLRRNTVLDFDPQTVSALDLRLPDGNVGLAKEDGHWKMVYPLVGKANDRAVGDLMGKLAGLKAQSWTAPQSVPMSATGLEKPYAALTLTLAGKGETIGLLIGSSMPSEQTYVKSASATSIALVKTADTVGLLDSGATYWDPVLYQLAFDISPTKLVLARRDDTFTVVRDGNAWKLTTPIQAPGEAPQVQRILRDLANVSAERIVYLGGEVPEKYAKATMNLTIEVYGQKPATQPASAPASGPATASAPASAPVSQPAAAMSQPATAASQPQSQPATKPALGPEELLAKLQVVKVGAKAYAWRPGEKTIAVGEFAPFLYDDLAAELREKTIWKIDANDVLALKLVAVAGQGADRVEERLELRREGSEWVNALNPDEKADTDLVGSYLAGLKDLSAERFMTYKTNPGDVQKLGLAQPWATLELRLAGGKTLNLAVSARGPGDTPANRCASSSSAEGIFVLPADIVGKLARKFSDLRKSPAKPAEGVQ